MEQLDIYNLGCHETLKFENQLFTYYITRVPGGWIYVQYAIDPECDYTKGNQGQTIFVPFDNEYQNDYAGVTTSKTI